MGLGFTNQSTLWDWVSQTNQNYGIGYHKPTNTMGSGITNQPTDIIKDIL